jgi:beta-galactosidase
MVRMSLLLLALTGAHPASAAITVRVQETPGGPQIHLNGKPIPPRFFFGSMNSGTLAATPEWQDTSFQFRPGVDVDGSGTLHFRFSQLPGEVWLADLRIQDSETGEHALPPGTLATPEALAANWATWPTAEANTVGKWEVADGALHVTLTDPPGGGSWPDFHFHTTFPLSFTANRAYRCSFRVRATPARPLSTSVYDVTNGFWNNIGGPPGSFLSQIALARDAGVNLVSFGAPACWGPPEEPQDWRPLDSLCQQIIGVNPRVLLVPRVGADAPAWWLERHPDAMMVFDDSMRGDHASVSDRTYRADACTHLEALCRHLTETFPDNFAGVHPCGQHTGEWFYERSWTNQVSGYDPATLEAFRAWLRAKGDPDADSAVVPPAAERRVHPYGLLRDPAREGRLIEFARFQQQEMATFVTEMAAACRRGTAGRKLVVFFYGYLFELTPLPNGAPTGGHYALSTVLRSPDIDVVCSPISYTDRDWLGTAPCMTAAESVKLAGKLWLNEDDSRTFLDPRQQERVQEGGLVDVVQTRQVMLRNTAQEALRGFGSWWMDLPAQGWFNDARIWEEMVRLHPVDAALAQRMRPFTPDVAAVLDEDSMCHLPGGSAVMAQPLIYDARAALGRSGAPYGQYLLQDVAAGRVAAKLQFLLSAWALTPADLAGLRANRAPGTVRVWCYAPGYIQTDRLDVAGIERGTGFAASPVGPGSAVATPTPAGEAAGLTKPWGPQAELDPLFTVQASPEETWATYDDGSPAVVVRPAAGGTDVFLGVPNLTPELVRVLARLAGVHLFTEDNSAVWATDHFISVQAHQAGPITINTGKPGAVDDALTGDRLGEGPRLTVDFTQGETKVLSY